MYEVDQEAALAAGCLCLPVCYPENGLALMLVHAGLVRVLQSNVTGQYLVKLMGTTAGAGMFAQDEREQLINASREHISTQVGPAR